MLLLVNLPYGKDAILCKSYLVRALPAEISYTASFTLTTGFNMPISVQCSCGKRMSVSDALAGRTIKCPACGDPLPVGASAAPAAGRVAAKKPAASPAIYVSQGKIIGVICLAICVILGCMLYFGPYRVWNQWEEIGPKASGDVSDVISFGLQAYESTNGMYNPAKSSGPSVDGNVSFFRPTLVMSMPEKVKFFGKTNEGDFNGWYNTKTGDIEADVAYGGMTFAGAVTLAKSTASFHMTGRMVGQFPQEEVNGTPIKIVTPPKDE